MRATYAMDQQVAHQVWGLLVAEAGATERDRYAFVSYLCTPDNLNSWEYRFIGTLGFGGKLHYNTYRGAYVSCYPSDRSEVRDDLILRLNGRLKFIAPGTHP